LRVRYSKADDFNSFGSLFGDEEPTTASGIIDRLTNLNSCNKNALVIYHGTNSKVESTIERYGLRPFYPFSVRDAVERIVRVYELIGWGGLHLGGFGVLKAFSYSDLSQEQATISFHLHSKKAALYASKDFSGGEILRAIRHAIRDLRQLVDEPQVLAECIRHRMINAEPWRNSEDFEISKQQELEILEIVKSEFLESFQFAFDMFDSYQYGVVYKIVVPPGPIRVSLFRKNKELRTTETIPPQFITEKYILQKKHANLPMVEPYKYSIC
jgi:hypothetical protein